MHKLTTLVGPLKRNRIAASTEAIAAGIGEAVIPKPVGS